MERPLTKEIKSHLKRARDNDDMEAEEIDTSDFQCHDHTDSVPGISDFFKIYRVDIDYDVIN